MLVPMLCAHGEVGVLVVSCVPSIHSLPPPSSTLFPYTTLFRSPIEESSYRRIVAEHFLKSSGTQAPGRLEEFLSSIDHRFCSKGQCKFTYDYPYVIRGADGRYHLVYSWNHSLIKHISFNDAWLETQL